MLNNTVIVDILFFILIILSTIISKGCYLTHYIMYNIVIYYFIDWKGFLKKENPIDYFDA